MSEWSSHDITDACEIADRPKLACPVYDEAVHSILERSRTGYDCVNLCNKYKYGLRMGSTLVSGVLANKCSHCIPRRLAHVERSEPCVDHGR